MVTHSVLLTLCLFTTPPRIGSEGIYLFGLVNVIFFTASKQLILLFKEKSHRRERMASDKQNCSSAQGFPRTGDKCSYETENQVTLLQHGLNRYHCHVISTWTSKKKTKTKKPTCQEKAINCLNL